MKNFFYPFVVLLSLCLSGCTQDDKKKEIFSILDEAAKSYFFIPENQYSGLNITPYYDSLLEKSDAYSRNSIKFEKAKALLYSGRTMEAIEIFKEFYDIKKNTYTVVGLSDQEEASIDKFLALSYLRLGEQENCLHHHSSASCIIPIREEGYHQLRFGSSEAIKIYEEILAGMPWDLESKWLLNIAYMTLGEYPERVPKEFLIPEAVFKSEYPLQPFTDIAPQLGLDVNQLSGGSIVDDFNNDGYLDIVVSSWFITHPLKLFINDQNGGFIDASAESGLDQIGGGLNMIQADYDNDGHMDILLLRGAWLDTLGLYPNALLKNKGDGTFEDVTIEAGLLSFHPTQTATWGDFNNDGWLDLFIGNESSSKDNIHPCELYINQQDGTFKEVAAIAGVSISTADSFHYVKGVVSGDFDNDGYLDIYISTINDDKPNVLLKNTGMDENNIPRFQDVTETAGISDTFSSFTCWFWDYNND
ncbi:MAG TPA: FG-GAP-like repeat-containing protein, partial [Anditalea sp.]|nr:FG-GAP-like repeat-containing protein [Anditalea sp.]